VLTWFIQLVDVECWLSGRSKWMGQHSESE
jgi:hypothetical protein